MATARKRPAPAAAGFAPGRLFTRLRPAPAAPPAPREAVEVPRPAAAEDDGDAEDDLDALPPLPALRFPPPRPPPLQPVPSAASAAADRDDEPYSPTQPALVRVCADPAPARPAVVRTYVCEVWVQRRSGGRRGELRLEYVAASAEEAREGLRTALRGVLDDADAGDAGMLECVRRPERFRFSFPPDSASATAPEPRTLFAALAVCELHTPADSEFSFFFLGDPP